ncbi:putative zinc finger cchc-type protein [Diplodia seriata]|uniref:Putative zinc finger cchc-type protein n=1 Tax=Diplodia seriata TaxID=420778 RepID=A0A0G2EDC5_9PEZI|nr:putative zinc finger cchc-type protein [Diplodia seriata]
MADDDSRTATLGRKRQRELQDDQANEGFPTPEKKAKLAEDDDESDYSPSPDLPQLEPSRERPASPSQHDVDFPHMSGAEESAAKASQLSTAQEEAGTEKPELPPPEGDDFIALPADDDYFAGENDEASDGAASDAGSENEETGKEGVDNGQATDTQSSSKGSGRIALTKKQSQLILTFEEERALRIMRTGMGGFYSAKKGFFSKDAMGAIISMAIPQIPDRKVPSKMTNGIGKDTICARVITAIGSNHPIGLLGIYHDQNQGSSEFNMLVVVRTQEQFDALKKFFAATPLEFALKGPHQKGKEKEKEFYFLNVLSADESKKLQFADNKRLSPKKGSTSVLAQALTHYVKQRLVSGELSPGDYEGFNPKEAKKNLQKAAKQDIGAGIIKADPQFAWEHLTSKPQPQSPPASKAQSQAPSKPTSVTSTKPSTPASEAQDTNFSSGEEGEITSEPVNNAAQPEIPQDTAQSSTTATATSNGQMRTHFAQLSEPEQALQVRYFGKHEDGLVPNLNKVARMTVSCYQCGSRQHWGDDCPMRPRKVTLKSNIFSAKEANKYLIDPEAAADELRQNGPGGQGMSIRGRAHGQGQHTYFSSTDDEGDIDNFYRNKRNDNNNNNNGPNSRPRGNIRINAGAGFRGGRFSQKNDKDYNGGGGGYGNHSQGWQPPLPNEPPPPLPPMPPSHYSA